MFACVSKVKYITKALICQILLIFITVVNEYHLKGIDLMSCANVQKFLQITTLLF